MTRALVAVFLCLAGAAGANPALSPADKSLLQGAISSEDAVRQGREGDVATLRRIIALRDPNAIISYGLGMHYAGIVMPAEVEALVVAHFNDPVLGPRLRAIEVPYRSRALYDLHRARVADAWLLSETSFAAVARARLPGIEEDLMRLSVKQVPDEDGLTGLADTVAMRRHPAALPALYSALGTSFRKPGYNRPFERLLRYPSLATWQETGRTLDRLKANGTLTAEQYQQARARLDPLLRVPAAALDDLRLRDAKEAFMQRRGALPFNESRILALKATDPAAYFVEATRYNGALEALAREIDVQLLPDVANAWFELGLFARFRARDVAAATRSFEKAASLGLGLAHFALGDTHQFERGDKAAAASAYRRALAAAVNAKGKSRSSAFDVPGTRINAWWQGWLQHEIAYLTLGRVPRVVVSEAQVGGFFEVMLANSESIRSAFVPAFSQFDSRGIMSASAGHASMPIGAWSAARNNFMTTRNATLARRIEALPASRLALMMATRDASALQDPEAMLAYFRRSDPSGYWSACVFATVAHLDGLGAGWQEEAARTEAVVLLPGLTADETPRPLSEAARRFMAEQALVLKPGKAAER